MNGKASVMDLRRALGEPEFKGWSVGKVTVGRVQFEDIRINSRDNAIDFIETITSTIERTKRARRTPGSAENSLCLPALGPTPLLSTAIENYVGDMKRRQMSASSLNGASQTLRLLLDVCGDVPVSRIKAPEIRLFWDLIRWIPRHARREKKFRDLSTLELVKLGREENVQPPSVHVFNQHLNNVTTFFASLQAMKTINESPLLGLKLQIDTSTEPTTLRAFSDDELTAIFEPGNFVPWARAHPHRWWGPMLALYTGARLTEIAQLKLKDICFKEGIWCLSFRRTLDERDPSAPNAPSSRQKMKSKSSIRSVPIAQPLLDAGFIDYLDDIRATKHPRLFPHLACGIERKTGEPNGRSYGRMLGSAFSKYVKRLGVEDQVAFHAFRHTISTELTMAGVPDRVTALIMGHANRAEFPMLRDHYVHLSSSFTLSEAVEALAKFRPSVKLPVYQRGQFRRVLSDSRTFRP